MITQKTVEDERLNYERKLAEINSSDVDKNKPKMGIANISLPGALSVAGCKADKFAKTARNFSWNGGFARKLHFSRL